MEKNNQSNQSPENNEKLNQEENPKLNTEESKEKSQLEKKELPVAVKAPKIEIEPKAEPEEEKKEIKAVEEAVSEVKAKVIAEEKKDAKEEVIEEAKEEVKEEVKAEAKEEVKAEVKEEVKAEAKEEEIEPKKEEKKEDVKAEKSDDDIVSDKVSIAESTNVELDVIEGDQDEEDGGEEDEDEDEDEDDVEEGSNEVEQKTLEELKEIYNGSSKEELVVALEELVTNPDIPKIKSRAGLIKVAFIKVQKSEDEANLEKFIADGGSVEDYAPVDDTLKERFNAAFQIYKNNRIHYLQDQEKLKLDNLVRKNEILEKLRDLINSEETLKRTYDEFKELQILWKEIGMVPAGEVNNLWQNYHFLVEKFFDKVKINKELRDLDLKKNLELKIELCEKAEELLIESSIIKSFKQLQKYHDDWKEVGPVPADKREDVWNRFRAATEKINERRKEYYEQLHSEQENNLMAKQALCEKAEKLVAEEPDEMKDWQVLTDQFNELFKVWRTIGRAPKKNNDEVWSTFKSHLNNFFNNKKEFLKKIKDEQLNNYNLKVEICMQAENLIDSTDWKSTTQELIKMQKDWKDIGPVPKKHSDKIWRRFRSACDKFFSNKSEYFNNIHKNEADNLQKKNDILEKLKAHNFESDKAENLKVIKDYQREWMDIGFVPIKEKERLQKEFRNLLDSKLELLKINSVELDAMNFKSRFENIKDQAGANRAIGKERSFISNKINKIKDEINLWENNIGFLAESKQASLLKAEFEKKINKAKQEVALLEAKLKYLRQVGD